MSSRQIEILAPAGSYDCFRAAMAAGADAVYAGGTRFGARAYADNFTEEELIRAIEEAHLFDKRLYLTVNTLLKENETDELSGYLTPLYERGLDAVIVQDIGVLEYVRTNFPGLEIHASTQMTITGYPGALFLEQAGAKRVVPARELSLEEIRLIRSHTDMEIECFVHGALCYCYSGQCLLSSVIGGRSGNRGQCAQPCRLPWTVNGRQGYYMSLKDMCTLELIPDLIEAGIDSFKIEGRMKKPEYVAAVTAMYRKYADLYLEKGRAGFAVEPEDREILMDLYNRGGFHTGYYERHNGADMLCSDRPNHAGVPALKTESCQGRRIEGTALTDLRKGDVIETGKGKKNNYTVGCEVKKGARLSFLLPKGMTVKKGTVFPRIRNENLIQTLHRDFLTAALQIDVHGILTLIPGCSAELKVSCRDCSFSIRSDEPVQKAQKRPLDAEQLKKRLSKTGGTEFSFNPLEIHMKENVFFPMQELNRMRREALGELRRKLITAFYRSDDKKNELKSVIHERKTNEFTFALKRHTDFGDSDSRPFLSVLTETAEQLTAAGKYLTDHPGSRIRRIYADCHMSGNFFTDEKVTETLRQLRSQGREIYVAMPRIFRRTDLKVFEKEQASFLNFPLDGILVRNYEEIQMLKDCGFDKNIILDHNLYVFNRYAKKFWTGYGIAGFTAPAELSAAELAGLGLESAELIVYGHLPVMVTAQCISSAVSSCKGRSGITYIEDRYRNRYPVKNYCASCYNIIYNTRPVYLGDQTEQIRRINPDGLRIQFSVEGRKQTLYILSLFENLETGEKPTQAEFDYTQGHFKRGII